MSSSWKHIFSCDDGKYDVYKLWQLAPKATIIPVVTIKGLNDDVWETGTSPVRLAQTQEGAHWKRSLEADLSYPIILTPNAYIADGNHRITVELADGMSFVLARRFNTWEEMFPALINPCCDDD